MVLLWWLARCNLGLRREGDFPLIHFAVPPWLAPPYLGGVWGWPAHGSVAGLLFCGLPIFDLNFPSHLAGLGRRPRAASGLRKDPREGKPVKTRGKD